jgi:zinc transport system substrate-binding protein
MSRNLISLSVAALLMAGPALADVPRVATDITPVQSLVARVMHGVGMPSLIVAAGASPHEYTLRPSQASALQDADLVFWVSATLTPWLDDAIKTLARDARVIELLTAEGTTNLPLRQNALFEAHHHEADHPADHHNDDDHDHDHGAQHADTTHAGHDDAAHDDHDPHAWLSPDNGAVWLTTIATALSAADPENAGTYAANAAAGRAELDALRTEINAILDPVRGGKFIVFHDAYQYFETAFDFPASGAISVSDAVDPSPARIAEIQARVATQGIACVLSEPQFNPGIVAAVMEGSDAQTAVLDPLGSDLESGAALYGQVLRNLAQTIANCL